MTSPKPLHGRAALITGANQGLGLAIARAAVEAGASVLMCARDGARLERARAEVAALAGAGQRVLARAGDVSRRDDAEQIGAAACDAFPDLQILVNNAGVYGPMGLIEDVDWDAWVRAMEINVFGSGTDVPCVAAALQAPALREDHPALGRGRHQSIPSPTNS